MHVPCLQVAKNIVLAGVGSVMLVDNTPSEFLQGRVAKGSEVVAGDVLDGIGGATFYSLIDTHEAAVKEGLLPVGLAKGARLLRAVEQDRPVTYNDVQLHEPSAILDLRRLQDTWMAGRIDEDALAASMDSMAVD